MKKKACIICAILLLSIVFCACSTITDNLYEYTIDTDYRLVWKTYDTRTALNDCYETLTPPTLFPASTTGLDVTDFFAKFDAKFTQMQFKMSVSYDQTAMEEELSRIEAIVPIEDAADFALPVAITVLGWDGCSEYALIDEPNGIIHYVYLESVQPDDIKFSDEFLPKSYSGAGVVDDGDYNFYLTLTEEERIEIARSER